MGIRLRMLVALLAIAVLSPFAAGAATDPTGIAPAKNLELCNELFNLPKNTIAGSSGEVMTAEVCAAYKDLIDRYRPGGDSARCITNVRVNGITSLNADFAVRLERMLKAADREVGRFYINSAFRNSCAQASANPAASAKGFVSMHSKGLAVDLIYPGGGTKYDCSSAGYRWIIANAKQYGIAQYDQVHPKVNGECNHIESINGGAGLGPGGAEAARSPAKPPLENALRGFLNGYTGASQRYYCITSIEPVIVVPSSFPPGPGCYNAQQPIPPQQSQQPTAAFQSASPLSPSTPSVGSVNTNTNTNENGTTSAFDVIGQFANPAATSATATVTPIALNPDLSVVAETRRLAIQAPSYTQNPVIVPTIPPVQQTFTSGDLTQPQPPFQQQPIFSAVILNDIKNALLVLMNYLRPFGGAPAPFVAE